MFRLFPTSSPHQSENRHKTLLYIFIMYIFIRSTEAHAINSHLDRDGNVAWQVVVDCKRRGDVECVERTVGGARFLLEE